MAFIENHAQETAEFIRQRNAHPFFKLIVDIFKYMNIIKP